ncbi:hypothetical protein [Polyangium sorediatum]|uniref:Uncharacterized protein n=1 Tax=Polyangium sorediatum TaxID=889274 RepID=A0ABT6P0D8_9BACT|nr:hypothetical protein [Polyangium sorediatum]MDI1434059.1 hypothetical protein [Polyangium sorediatum]
MLFPTGTSFSLAEGTEITYKIVTTKYRTVAEVITAGKRPPATDVGGEMRTENEARRKLVVEKKLGSSKVKLRGQKSDAKGEPTGAYKHYADADAVAKNDEDVYKLIKERWQDLTITEVNTDSDTFKIPLNLVPKDNRSIVGDIIYADKDKKIVQEIVVFHVGPSQ